MKKSRIILLYLTLLILTSCKEENKNFEISNLTTDYIFLDNYTRKGPNFEGKLKYLKHHKETGEWDKSLLEKENYIDARFFDLNFDVKNNTGEKIETASIVTILSFYYKNDIISYRFSENQFLHNFDELWDVNSVKSFETRYLFNDLENYESSVFEHTPEKVQLTIYINARNSVGFDNSEFGDKIYDDEIIINNWK